MPFPKGQVAATRAPFQFRKNSSPDTLITERRQLAKMEVDQLSKEFLDACWLDNRELVYHRFAQQHLPLTVPSVSLANQGMRIAASYSNDVIVTYLLCHGAQINSVDAVGNHALNLACMSGSYDTVRLLVRSTANVNQANSQGESSLLCACEHGREDVAEFLLASGAHVNTANNWGETALMIACKNGWQVSLLELLLKNQANVRAQNVWNETVLHLAAENGFEDALDVFLQHGAALNTPDSYGNTALKRACAYGFQAIAEKLIQNGADVNVRAKDGDTALHEILCWFQYDTFLHPETDLPQRSRFRHSCRVYASLLQRLVQAGAHPDVPDEHGKTVLHYMADQQVEDFVRHSVRRVLDDESRIYLQDVCQTILVSMLPLPLSCLSAQVVAAAAAAAATTTTTNVPYATTAAQIHTLPTRLKHFVQLHSRLPYTILSIGFETQKVKEVSNA